MKKRVVLLLLTAAFMIVCAIAPYIALAAVPNVSIAVPQKTVIRDIVNCSGNIEQADEKSLTMNVPLVASSIHYEVGDTVSKGDVIATIDQQESIKQLSASQSDLSDSYMGVPKEVIEAALAGKATEEQIEKELPKQILSPGNGVITDINLRYNQANDPTRPVVTVSASDGLVARVSVGEANISKIKEGNRAVITGTAFEDIYYTATVKKVYPTARKNGYSTTGEVVVDVLLQIDNPDANLRAGYSTSARIDVSDGTESCIIPYSAVRQDESNQEYVYVYENGHAVKRPGKTGREFSEVCEVLEGVTEDDVLILNPDAVKREGIPVKIGNSEGSKK